MEENNVSDWKSLAFTLVEYPKGMFEVECDINDVINCIVITFCFLQTMH